MLQSVVRFSEDAAALEKTLRGLQGFVTIAVGLAQSQEDIDFWLKLRSQFALGRRYFRLLKWHPCWKNASSAAGNPDFGSLRRTLEVIKFGFLGMYFFLEMFTITNALGATNYEWGPRVQMEANKCWFYSISVSIFLCLYTWLMPEPLPEQSNGKAEHISRGEKADTATSDTPTAASTTKTAKSWAPDPKFKTQLLIDFSDVVVPGAAVGWIPVGPITVGIASTISTFTTGRQIWNRVQQSAIQP
ncbi:hypothetical protein CKM354_000495300 [Cercospora kikuchii]|uniref:Uncharacterized protein n=1 Tax=Cercospora kikuchii TaxID=84275 RepID=A0A9P3FGA2_9PEZI|nr:uncharacterized protein CKM354_000495300 [Cercospora kikuchii]GIZ41654.1 hypothetical protein CKM354_000495300 [Cercospora kikuchii]